MAKGPGRQVAADRPGGRAGADDLDRDVRRLERRLADAQDLEAKRRRRLEKARRHGASRATTIRRRQKLAKAQRRRSALAARIEHLQARRTEPAGPETDAAAVAGRGATPVSDAAPRGYCLRERRRVGMVDVTEIVMRNGRRGLAGSCPACGCRVVRSA